MNFRSSGESAGIETPDRPPQPFEERHFPVVYWARLWGFSAKLCVTGFAMNSVPAFSDSKTLAAAPNAITQL
jgi:hypothetical protein